MTRTELTCDFDPAMVVLSFLVAYVGSYMAISLLEQLRLYQVNIMDAEIVAKANETESSSRSQASDEESGSQAGEVIVGKKQRFLFNSKEGMKFAILVSCFEFDLLIVVNVSDYGIIS